MTHSPRSKPPIVGVNIVKVGTKNTLPKLDHEVGVDITPAGVLIESTAFIAHSKTVHMNVFLTKNEVFTQLKLKGKVLWTKRYKKRRNQIAVAFQFLSPKSRETLERFLS
jgi:hypothetical protein